MPSLLLEHFDTLLATPADVEFLNRAILTLAVQGNLVDQDPDDEPASELVKKIRQERKDSGLKPVAEKEKTFDLPKGWVWVRFEDVVEIMMGQSPPGNTYNETGEGTPLINGPVEFGNGHFEKTKKTKFTTEPTKMCKEGDLLICVRGSTTGRTNIAGFDACIGRGVAALRSKFKYQDYINYFILHYRPNFFSLGTGSTFPSVSFDKIQTIPFPLPPLAEQKRIVARVETLFAQTRALSAKLARAESELTHLNQSALFHLLAADAPDEFEKQWDFIAAHFESLFTRPEHVAPLRQSILELAVRGKLTRREAGDESARELLKRIRKEKEERGKKEVLPLVKESEKPFALPEGWEWCRWDDVSLTIGDVDHKMPEEVPDGVPYISPRDFTGKEGISFSTAKKISRQDYENLVEKIKPERSDIIFPRYGTIGVNRFVSVDFDFLASYSCAIVKHMKGLMNPRYVFFYSISPFVGQECQRYVNKTTQPNVGNRVNSEIPISPAAFGRTSADRCQSRAVVGAVRGAREPSAGGAVRARAAGRVGAGGGGGGWFRR